MRSRNPAGLLRSDARAQAQTESARSAVAVFKALCGEWQSSCGAFCRERGAFRDFVLSRMEVADETAPRSVDPSTDAQRHEFVVVQIRPHHKLSPAQAQLVATDFGMSNGIATFDCRRALLWYVLLNLGLDEERLPPRQLIDLSDPHLLQSAAQSDSLGSSSQSPALPSYAWGWGRPLTNQTLLGDFSTLR